MNWKNMSPADWDYVRAAIRRAAEETIAVMGIDALRQTSWFPSSDWNQRQK